MGHLEEVPGFWLWLDSAAAAVAIREGNQQKEDFSLCNAVFQMNFKNMESANSLYADTIQDI